MSDDAGAVQEQVQDEVVETGADKKEHDQIGFLKRQLRKAQEEAEALKRAQMSDAERIQVERDEALKRATAAEERMQTVILQSRFESAAREAGIPADLVDLAFSAVDRSVLGVDENGKVRGLKVAIDRLAKERPTLFVAQALTRRSAGGGNPPGGQGASSTNQKMNDFLRGRF